MDMNSTFLLIKGLPGEKKEKRLSQPARLPVSFHLGVKLTFSSAVITPVHLTGTWYLTWVSTFFSIDGKVPAHTARGTACDPHVSIPRNPYPRVITSFIQCTHLKQ